MVVIHAPKYFSGSVVAAGIGLAMNKYYTNAFNPEQFGVLSLYLIITQYITLIASGGADKGLIREYYEHRLNGTARDSYLSTVYWFCVLCALFILGICLVIESQITGFFGGEPILFYVSCLAGISAVFVSIATNILICEQHSNKVLQFNVIQAVLSHGISFILIFYFSTGLVGRQYGQFLAYATIGLSAAYYFVNSRVWRPRLSFDYRALKQTLLFGLPGTINTLLGLLFLYMDRLFINAYRESWELGVYFLAFILGKFLSTFFEAIASSIFPNIVHSFDKDELQGKKDFKQFALGYYAVLICLTFVGVLAADLMVKIFSNDTYIAAGEILRFSICGMMIGGFYKMPLQILNYYKDIYVFPIYSVCSLAINVLLNWSLVPEYGGLGAAYATFMSLFVYSYLLHRRSFSYLDINYSKKVFSLLFIVLLSISGAFFLALGVE